MEKHLNKFDNKVQLHNTWQNRTIFKGHFENCPILPGVVQLHFVIKFIQMFFHKNVGVYDIIKLKFTNLILPDTLVHFELNKLSEDEFSFCYENGDVKYSAGKIVIKE